ncbi:iron-hydroxamate ABC transporter substrate-binding protein [Vibrio navarrensis]|uniref:TIGR04219 family outer membrane beta-barrel protein n=1 Tax=Vibrio navarrensis TaxID=29495 RepID=UPI001865FE2D|nr:TIGR04219 family outer membrane beta-barrel protein [Vibrio navarrensis]MBE3654219.1 iron-hydroxamate ABC transporter substrate-binding protein [Vibrio navarrensis]MBE3658091.1 iron-hydroxamate ABC transporter substrate-binding protein [Vibrio navarrensis]MBE3670614.1 iron-hydroxamate ABC transporter substrate-binding protein [Vibrio navarrensis]
MLRTLAISAAACTLSLSFPLLADSDLDFTAGAEFWNVSTKVNEVKRDAVATGTVYTSLEHPIKYLPNARLRFSSVDADYMAFDKLDATFYYQVLDHELLHFDAGITVSDLSNSKYLDLATAGAQAKSFDELIWAWYGYAEITVPETQFDVIGEMNFGDSKGIKSTDLMAGMQYKMPLEQSQLTLRAGYRVIDLESDTFASSLGKSFIFANGWFLGAQYHF